MKQINKRNAGLLGIGIVSIAGLVIHLDNQSQSSSFDQPQKITHPLKAKQSFDPAQLTEADFKEIQGNLSKVGQYLSSRNDGAQRFDRDAIRILLVGRKLQFLDYALANNKIYKDPVLTASLSKELRNLDLVSLRAASKIEGTKAGKNIKPNLDAIERAADLRLTVPAKQTFTTSEVTTMFDTPKDIAQSNQWFATGKLAITHDQARDKRYDVATRKKLEAEIKPAQQDAIRLYKLQLPQAQLKAAI